MLNNATVVMTDYQYDSIAPISSKLQAQGVAFSTFQCRTEEEVIAVTRDAQVVITHFAPITRKVITELRCCKLIVRGAVGVDNIDVEAARQRGIPVANVPDYGRDDVANHVIMLMLALNKKVCLLNRAVKSGSWDFNQAKPIHRLQGRVLGLLGFGGIARLVAKKSRILDMEVQAYDPYVSPEAAAEHHVAIRSLEEVLQTSDVISVHMPLNNTTRHLLNKEAFARMKPGAVLINTARGGIIHEADLVEALQSGKIGAAGLDVLDQERIEADNPLRNLDQVILTPHSAWYSEESVGILLNSVADEVLRALEGKPLRNPVWR